MASPPRAVSVSLASDDLVVASLNLRLEPREQVETATQYRFGITETQFVADVDRKAAQATGPDVVRFHEAGDRIRSRIDGALRSTWVVLSGTFLEDLVAGTPAWRAPFRDPFVRPPLASLAAFHRFVARTKTGVGALRAQEELADLLPRLLSPGAAPKAARLGPGATRLVRRADELLGDEFSQVDGLTSLARRLGVSASYLARVYRTVTGGTIHARVTRLRMARALCRLAEGATDLTALALELGYSSHSHFSAEFKRHVGRPPRVFRLSTQI